MQVSTSTGQFTLTGPLFVNAGGGTGDLSVLTVGSFVTANPVTISGIHQDGTQTPEPYSAYLVFSGGNGGFQFNLTSVAETGFTPGFETFHGVGTLVDTVSSDGYDPTAATFTLAFSTAGGGLENFNITLNTVAVPEPATYGAVGGVGLLLVSLGSQLRRKQA